jgi:hypothetical protein
MEKKFTLLSDGSSDRALLPIIRWTLRQHATQSITFNGDWADLRRLPKRPRDLSERIARTLSLFRATSCSFIAMRRGRTHALDTKRSQVPSSKPGFRRASRVSQSSRCR